MYKAFVLPHFDYADVVWDNCTNALSDEIEKLNLDAIRTIIGAVRGTSHHKLYEESGLIPLKERRRRHKLLLYFKIIRGMTPQYLNNYLPPLVSEINPYHRRNPLERYTPGGRTELYQQSFFPSATVEWNSLPDRIKSLDSIAQFKRYLAINDSSVPPYYHANDRFSEIRHCKLRLEISDLKSDLHKRHLTEDKSCACGKEEEDAYHYLLECPLYRNAREMSIHTLPNFADLTIRSLTHGNSNLSIANNTLMFEKVQEFIRLSKRFP